MHWKQWKPKKDMSDNKITIHSIKYNFVMNTILRMSSFIFPLITFPYVSRILGASLNGKISFASSYVNYFTMVAQLGIPTYGIRACAQVRDNKSDLSKTVQELFIINSITMVLSYAVLLCTVFLIPRVYRDHTVVLISSVTVILSCIGMEWFYQGIEQYDYITIRNIIFKFISIGLMFCFVHKPEDYVIYAGINVLGTVGSNALNFIRIRKFVFIRPIGNYDLKRHLRPIMVLFLFTVAATIYTSLDSVMLGFMSTDEEVGYYAAAIKMRNILYSLVTSLGTVLLPRASYLIKEKKFDEFGYLIKKSFQFIAVLSFPLTLFFVCESKDTIYFLAGNGYQGAITAMMIITPTIIFAGFSNITGIQILIPLGLEKYTVISTCGGALTDLVLNAIFIPKYGSAGAAFGTLIAELVVLIMQIIFLVREKMSDFLKIDYANILKILISSAVPLFVILMVKQVITISSSFVSLLVCAIIYFGIFAILLLMTKEQITYEYGVVYLRKLFRRKCVK